MTAQATLTRTHWVIHPSGRYLESGFDAMTTLLTVDGEEEDERCRMRRCLGRSVLLRPLYDSPP